MFDEASQLLGCQSPKQFTKLPKAISVCSIPIEDAIKVNAQYQQEIAKLNEEDIQALNIIDKIYTD